MATTKGQSRRRKPSSPDDGPVAATATTQAQDAEGTRRASPSRNGAEPQALDTETTLDLYRKMNTIRFFEDAAQRGFRQGKIGGYLHLYSGQEAVATGFSRSTEEATRSSPPTATTPTPSSSAVTPTR